MAEGKKSFILYADLIHVVKKIVLRDREQKTNHAGELFLHILEYVNDTEPIPIDFIVDMAFEPIKLSLKRDLKRYESYIEKQKVNGAKGGRPKNPKEPKKGLGYLANPLEPKKADSVNDSDSVNDMGLKEPPPQIAVNHLAETFEGNEAQQCWRDWLEYKVGRKEMLNAIEQKYARNRLIQDATVSNTFSERNVIKIINLAISKGWKNLQLDDQMKVKKQELERN